ncbi:mitochondrial import inner membrane translocase subunit Tim9p [[Candida] railenensis]|uniref:Mitochondrial import inner membrane translocase subunit n=1 Tax=[Candida] railenensis TaxID=45579 RepID=A0A9P0QNG7_9ASCO|nr:mitochondrial import inner membrane translocase subunit Tim9p [[Candida] railenensis]
MDQLNVKEQQEFQQIVEQKQMKDFMRLYSNLVSKCFDDCVNDFTSANLTTKESSCITKCSEKFLKHSERVGQRFQEQKYVLVEKNRRCVYWQRDVFLVFAIRWIV